MVITPVSLSLATRVLERVGLNAFRPLWWKEHAISQARHPLHLSSWSHINGFH